MDPETTPNTQDPPEDNYASEGLAAKLAEFRAANPPDRDEPEEVSLSTPPADPPAAPVTPAAADDADEPDIEFPDISAGVKPEPKPATFDEAAFDAETEKEVAALDPKQAGAWKQVKERMKAAEKKAAEMSAIASAAKPSPEIEAEITRLKAVEAEAEALRQRNQELLRANDQTAVRESDEFKRAISAPLDEMTTVIKAMAEAAELDPSSLAAIIEEQDIGKQDKMIDALGSKLSPRALNRVERLADDYKAILQKEREMLAEAGKTIEQQRVARHKAEQAEQARKAEVFKAAVSDSFKTYAAAVPGFTDSTGALTDLGVAVMEKTSLVDISKLGPEDLGYLAYAANAIPEMRRALVKANKELAVLKGSKPRSTIAAGSPPVSTPPDDDIAEDGLPMGLLDRMKGRKFSPVGMV